MSHIRIQTGITQRWEKQLLFWIAVKLPTWVAPDLLTATGLAAQCAAGLCYLFSRWQPLWLMGANAAIAVNWFGDSLDGTVARVRHIERPQYGYYVDHVCDIYGTIVLLGGMAASGLLDWRLALALLIAFLVAAAESFLAVASLQRFEMAHWGVGPTELRLLLIAANIAALVHPPGIFNLGAALGAACLLAATTWVAVCHARELNRSANRHRNQPGHHHADAEQGDCHPERHTTAAAAAMHDGKNQGNQPAEKGNHGRRLPVT
ncbi:MAG TPA: CDP-alcohol phosphatidyltransferase family protein [Terriglobales bacterium]|nr:CDP-alcohol phosphatidyltransferase family protein [Terriglobales bacterium]